MISSSNRIICAVVVLCTLWFAMPVSSFGQGPEESRTALLKVLRSLDNPEAQLKNGNKFLLKLEARVVPKDSIHLPIRKSLVTYLLDETQLSYQDDRMRVIRDADLTATVMPSIKKVYLSKSADLPTKKVDLKSHQVIQTKTYEQMRILNNGIQKKSNGQSVWMIAFAPTIEQSRQLGLSEIRFSFDPALNRLISCRMVYAAQSELAYTELRYLELDYNHRSEVLSKPVKQLLFSSGERFQPEYFGYELIKLAK